MRTEIVVTLFLGIVAFAGTAQAQKPETLIWADANGEVVGPYSPYYVDDGGFLWSLDAERGTLFEGGTLRVFLAADCTGTPYVIAIGLPRVALRVGSLPGLWTRSDTERAQTQHFGSMEGDVCLIPNERDWPAVPQSTLKAAPDNPPILPFTPPFHVEKR